MPQGVLPRRISDLPSCSLARMAGWSLLLCMGVGIVGIPLPEPKVLRDSVKFPCMDCPCGCHTATQCWDQCCCYTDSQKVAWARSHGVQPPDFLLARCALAAEDPSPTNGCSTSARCSSPPCCSGGSCGKVSTEPTCCQAKKSELPETCSGSVSCEAPAQLRGTTVVLWRSVQRCKGINLLWNLLSHGWLPSEAMPCIASGEPPFLGYLAVTNDSAASLATPPDPPVA